MSHVRKDSLNVYTNNYVNYTELLHFRDLMSFHNCTFMNVGGKWYCCQGIAGYNQNQ